MGQLQLEGKYCSQIYQPPFSGDEKGKLYSIARDNKRTSRRDVPVAIGGA